MLTTRFDFLPVRRSCLSLRHTARFVLTTALVWSCLATGGLSSVQAQDDQSNEIDYPLVLINSASVQRLRDSAGFMFQTAQQQKKVDGLDPWMESTLKDLKGIDRTRPFGMMLYLSPSLIGAPVGISYIPVTNLDEALTTLAYGAGTITPVDGKSGRHEIAYGERFKIRTLHRGGYIFLVGPDGSEDALDRNFPDPVKLTARLSSQYDIAISLLIKSVPPGMKTLFVEFLKNQAQAEFQQKDDEPESAYRLRRANGESWLELVDKVVNQGEELTIGGRMDPENRRAYIDFEIAGTSDSKLAKFFQDMAGKRTYFGNLIQNPATLTMSVSWLLDAKQRGLFTQFFEVAKKEIAERADKDGVANVAPMIDPIFKALLASAEAGHIDGFVQIVGDEPGRYAMIGGTKLIASRNLPTQISDLLQFVKDNPNGNETIPKLELAAEAIDSHPVHRIQLTPPDKPGQKMFGESSYLYLYATPQAIWFAFGGDAAMDALKEAVAQTALPQDPMQNRNRVPFQFVTHAKNWLTVASEETPRQVSFNETARASFESENDAMRVDVKPTDTGVRLRIEFEEGFIALMGRGISKGIDEGVFRGPQPGQQRPGRGPRQGRPERANPPRTAID
ncbi:MAG: hypothetical protein H7062_18035 [Candidatus Saccharimonas sp.]|nr:hypothetical protein [Planctomycetaceae bacterium]